MCNNRLYPFSLAEIEGEFKADEIDNSGVSIFMSLLPEYLEANKLEYSNNEVAELESQIVSAEYSDGNYAVVLSDEEGMLPFRRIEYETKVWRDTISPLVKVAWGQGSPYNSTLDSVPNESGNFVLPPVGCVAVAVGQILSYHKAPSSITVGNLNWEGDWDAITMYPSAISLSETYRTQVANLLKVIGKGVNMSYAWDGSGSNIGNAYSFLTSDLKFNADPISDYNFSSVSNSLHNNCPIYMRGTSYNQDGTQGYIGHAWVLDGVMTEYNTTYENIYECTIGVPSTPINPMEWRLVSSTLYSNESYLQVHCNWGQYGYNNGYYQSDVFNYGSNTYDQNLLTICNIKPN